MTKIDMTGNGKNIAITTNRKPLDGIEFTKRAEPNWVDQSKKLCREIEKAHRHAEYCEFQASETESKLNNAKDSMQKLKLKQDMEYWRNQLREARSRLAELSRELANFHKKSR